MGPLKGQDSHDPQDLCPMERDEAIWKSQMEDTNGRIGRVREGAEEVMALDRCRLRMPVGHR